MRGPTGLIRLRRPTPPRRAGQVPQPRRRAVDVLWFAVAGVATVALLLGAGTVLDRLASDHGPEPTTGTAGSVSLTAGPIPAGAASAGAASAAAPLAGTTRTAPAQEVLSFVSPDAPDLTATALDRAAAASSALAVTGAALGPGGALVEVPDGAVLRRAHAHRARGLLVFSDYDAAVDDFNGPAAAAVLGSAGSSARLRTAIGRAVRSGGWDGVVVDLEALPAAAAPGLVALVAGLKADLGGRELVVCVPAGTDGADLAAYDLPRLAASADRIDWMAYDQHTGADGPGPVGGLPWVRAGLAWVLHRVPPGKLLLGVAGYGYVWPARGTPRELDAVGLTALERTPGARVRRDPAQGELTVRLADGGTAWFSDAEAVARRGGLARDARLSGIALWRVGSQDPATWTRLPAAAKP